MSKQSDSGPQRSMYAGADGTTYQYVADGTPYDSDYETRHEAIGALARFGDWASGRVVAVAEDCLVEPGPGPGDLTVGPQHLGNQYFGDRRQVATKHGLFRINRETVVREVNGNPQEQLESAWVAECPICYHEHRSDEASEDSRKEFIDEVCACCGTEWWPPSDWVQDCSICGKSHRGEFGCSAVHHHEQHYSGDDPLECVECGWGGRARSLAIGGYCPDCDSGALEVTEA